MYLSCSSFLNPIYSAKYWLSHVTRGGVAQTTHFHWEGPRLGWFGYILPDNKDPTFRRIVSHGSQLLNNSNFNQFSYNWLKWLTLLLIIFSPLFHIQEKQLWKGFLYGITLSVHVSHCSYNFLGRWASQVFAFYKKLDFNFTYKGFLFFHTLFFRILLCYLFLFLASL